MASKAEYVQMAQLIGRFLLPLGLQNGGDEEEDELALARRGLITHFITQLSAWYQQDNLNFSPELFYNAINDFGDDAMEKFNAWSAKNGGIEALESLLDAGKELPDFPDGS